MAGHRRSPWLLLSVLVVAAAPACGKALLPGTAYKEPLLQFSGDIFPPDALAGAKNPRLGIVWTDPMQRQEDITSSGPPFAWNHLGRTTASGPGSDRYAAAFYRPPPAAALVEVAAPLGQDGVPDSAILALGEVVLFDDLNQDYAFSVSGPRAEIDEHDIYLAGADQLVLYVAKPFSRPQPASFPLGTATQTGYMTLSVTCEGRVPTEVRTGMLPAVSLLYQRTMTIPELRVCMSTHSP